MHLIDTHTHLYLPEFDTDRDSMVERAVSSSVVRLLMPNIDIHSVEPMLAAAEKYKGICFPMIGLHPTSVKEDYEAQLNDLEKIAERHRFIAVGEIGIDLYWDKKYLKEQIIAFRRQIKFAIEHSLPAVIHSRESFPEVISVLDEFRGAEFYGVFHAFSGSIDDAERAVRMGFKLGIGGPLTYKNSTLPGIVKEMGIKHIVLETDSPYLSPVPYRGKRNESSYICIINRRLSEILEISEENSAFETFENSCHLFNLS